MRKVFIYPENNLWKIIDKSNDTLFDVVDDVLMFNGEYRRYKNIKGWHGILSEEFNSAVKGVLQNNFTEINFFPKLYYPRTIKTSPPIKTISFIKFKPNNKIFGLNFNTKLYEPLVKEYCRPWSSYIDDPIEE